MNIPTSPHPTDQTLSGFGLGTLDDGLAGTVEAHLNECARCRERVAAVTVVGVPVAEPEAQAADLVASVPAQLSATITHNKSSRSAWPEPDPLDSGLAEHPDYELIRELGRGGMGVVYLAHNRLMGRHEVLKVMGRHVIDNPGVSERFLREIRAVARLRHENIVTAYSATRLGESIAFAMEYVEGLDLSKLVRAKGPLPVAIACHFTYQAALGLQHAHEEGLVHRDIKPGNLMLTRKGRKATIKVLDFGLAKVTRAESFAETLTHDGQALGTPDFIAPEQITSAQTVDIRADIYSLGATLYYLLSGQPPFKASSLYDMFQAHISREPDPLNLVRPEVPPELAAVVAGMMAKDPSRRFPTPRAAAQALKPFFQEGNAAFKSPDVVFSSSGGFNEPRPRREPAATATPAPLAPVPGTRTSVANASTTPEVRWESLIEFHEADEPEAHAPAGAEPGRPRAWVWPLMTVGVLTLGLLAALLMIGLHIRTSKGVLVFDGLPAEAVVTVDGEVVAVEWPGGDGPAKVSVAAGEHSVRVEFKGVEIAGDEVKINVGNQQWIRVRLVPDVSARREDASEPVAEPRPAEVATPRTEAAATPREGTDGSPTGSVSTEAPLPATKPAAATVAATNDVLYADTFDNPGSGWPQEDPNVARKEGDSYHFGYANGVWFNSGSGLAEWSQSCPYRVESEFQLKVVGRVLDATPESRGRWTVHIRPTDPKRRGLQVAIERNGVLALDPSFWDRASSASDPRIGPIVLRDFRTGTEFNSLVLRVKNRQVQILCNGTQVCPPVSYDWDLTPAVIHVGVDGYSGSYRAEFDQIEIRKPDGESTGPITRTDSLQSGSVWLADPGKFTFTVLERDGERIKARFLVGSQVREINGTVQGDRLRWYARDVKVISGKPGGDHEGEIKGDQVAMTWSHPGVPVAGKFTLTLSKPAPAAPEVKPESTAARTPNLLFFDEFDDPRTGWDQEDAKEPEAVTHGHGYRNGVFFLSHSEPEGVSYSCARDFGGDFQVEVSGRVLDATPDSRGFWVVHLIPVAPGLGGFQVGIDRSGVLVLEPTFWRKDDSSGAPRIGPIPVRNFRRGNKFNTLMLRVKKRQVEVLVNSTRVGPIVSFGWDLTPAALHLGLNVKGGSTRAEFDRIEVKELPGAQAVEPKR